MRICFFTENYYKGGLDTFLINLFNSWPDTEDELSLVCNGSHPGLDTILAKTRRRLDIEKYNYIFTSKIAQGQSSLKLGRSFPVRAFFVLSYRIIQYPILFPWYIGSLVWFFSRNHFDRLMVVNGGYPASMICQCALIAWKLAGKRPLGILNFHNLAMAPPWYSRIPERWVDKAVSRASSQIISVSKACLETLKTREAFAGSPKLQFIYNGIEDPAQMEDVPDENIKVPSNDRYCLMLATYESRKGHSYLLQAFNSLVAEFPDVYLKIFGYGRPSEIQKVKEDVKRLSLEGNVSLNGFTPDTTALIRNASVLVVPSQEYESFGLTIIEAMALGTPIVTTNVGGMPEVLAGSGAGYVCSKDNPLEFAGALKKILGDKELALELGRNGRLTFEQRYTSSKMAFSYMQILKNLY